MILCNGRCLNYQLTGIQRYTTEILRRLPQIHLLMAPSFLTSSFWKGKVGHLWEQGVLPLQARNALLWNPANTGPVLLPVRSQVVTLHDLFVMDDKDSPCYYKWMLPKLLAKVAGVLTVSEFSRRQIVDYCNFPSDRIVVTPLGVDHELFHPYPEAEVAAFCRRLDLRPGYVLSVGAGMARKNLASVLKAWNIAQRKVDEKVDLVIAGDPAAYGQQALDGTTIPPPLPPRTKLAGRISDADLPLLMAAAGVLTFPSLREGFGLPPLEAMACGTPCIVSNTTSLPEVVGEAALKINPLEIEELAHAITRLLTDIKLHQQLSRAALIRSAEFTWDKTADLTWCFLKKCSV